MHGLEVMAAMTLPPRADELRVHPTDDSDLRIPMEQSADPVEPLLLGLAVLTVLILVVWFLRTVATPG
jgi:hypothetical protein